MALASFYDWQRQHPLWYFAYPDPDWLADDYLAQLKVAIYWVVKCLPFNEHEFWLLEVWRPHGWLWWWSELVPQDYHDGLVKTLYRGEPYNAWRDTLRQCFSLSGLRRRSDRHQRGERAAYRLSEWS